MNHPSSSVITKFTRSLIAVIVLLSSYAVLAASGSLQGQALDASADFVPLPNLLQLVAGDNHGCVLVNGGEVQCWGGNTYGQLGDGTLIDHALPAPVAGLTRDVRAIAAGANQTCALSTGGGVKCWGGYDYYDYYEEPITHTLPIGVAGLESGVVSIATGGSFACAMMSTGGVKCWGNDNVYGQLGNGTTEPYSNTVDVVGLGSGVNAIAAGDNHACAVLNSGSVKCWGANNAGQLGDSTTTSRSTPVDVVGLTGISAVVAGSNYTCALSSSGAVKCWGDNYYGQLGDGGITSRSAPVNVVGLSSGASAIAAGSSHTCAVTDGSAKCWGYNGSGQLGDATTVNRTTPVDVIGMSGVATVESAALPHAISVSDSVSNLVAGGSHTCARLNSGQAKCWGGNSRGQLGNGTSGNRVTPTDVAGLTSDMRTIDASSAYTCAVTNGGGVKCWGTNYSGQLGDGTTTNRPSPVDVVGLTGEASALAVDGTYSCVLMSGGRAKCWGANYYGQVGDGTTTDRPSAVDVAGLASGVIALDVGGYYYSCALTSGGAVKCWGYNGYGQLGDGTTTNRPSPVDVVGLTSGVSSFDVGYIHTCALLSGAVKCWGYNGYGQLGDGTTTNRPSPVNVVGLSSGVIALDAGGTFHTCALLSGGGVKCWGYNGSGQLGDGTTTNRPSPVNVTGLTSGVIAIGSSSYHTCALTSGGGVKCWGDNGSGQLGDGTTTNRPSPVDVVGLSSGVSTLAVGTLHTCALLSGGGVKCWGYNSYGQLGDGTTTNRPSPVDVVGLSSGVIDLDVSDYHSCALLSGGGVKCWGNNSNGELGSGDAWRTTPADVLSRCYPLSRFHVGAGADPVATPASSAGCPADQFSAGETIQLQATPATGWAVSSWSGTTNDANTGTTNTLLMSSLVRSATVIYASLPDTPPPSNHDAYEPDDACAQAHVIAADGTAEQHTFHQVGDGDWLKIQTTAGAKYRVEVQASPDSPADVNLELYPSCESAAAACFAATFTPGVRQDFTASTSDAVYLRLTNGDPAVAGTNVGYQVSVRQLDMTSPTGALILVAGRLKSVDPVQKNIDGVTQAVYNLYLANGYGAENIQYLASDASLKGYDQPATVANLQAAITTWAAGKVSANKALTLYLMDHGDQGKFFLDGVNKQEITPDQLDAWLDQLEAAVSGVKITVIIEACFSGSFIDAVKSISKPGRLIMTSTTEQSVAYASADGAYFSDQLIASLQQGYSLHNSFRSAYVVARELTGLLQEPWLDGNGNSIPNEAEDVTLASQRGTGYADKPNSEIWAPYVVSAQGPSTITNRRGVIQTEVRDDKHVRRVWAVIYAPSYRPPAKGLELVPETLPTVVLQGQGGDRFAGEYPGFDELGLYRIAVYAEDDDGLIALPKVISVRTGYQMFLPAIAR